jgi:uncharacterized membrane protein YcaP (DUF421 family)
VLAISAYVTLVVLLRLSGKRILTKLNVFDFIFVVALGSTLANTIISNGTSLAEGAAAFVALIAIQVLLSWACLWSGRINHLINGEPVLVLLRGEFLLGVMRRERVTEAEVRAAVRNDGIASMDAVEAVVLETDGTLSVVQRCRLKEASSLKDVTGHPAAERDKT